MGFLQEHTHAMIRNGLLQSLLADFLQQLALLAGACLCAGEKNDLWLIDAPIDRDRLMIESHDLDAFWILRIPTGFLFSSNLHIEVYQNHGPPKSGWIFDPLILRTHIFLAP